MKKIISKKLNKKHFNSIMALLIVGLMVVGSVSIKGITASAASTRNYSAEEINEGNQKTLNISASADADALPEGVTLKAKKITSKDDNYKQIKSKVEEKNKNKEVNFLAYDIGFYTKDNEKVEPKGEVKVNMSWNNAIAPKGTTNTDDISILHLKENDKGDISKVENITKDKDTDIKTETNKVKSADFSVDSFSVFTVTWTKSDTDSTQIGNVKVRYVDTNGLEIDTSETFNDNDLAKMAKKDGGIVDLESDWANKNDTSRVSGYTYDHAVIGSRDGTTITGVKVEKSTEKRRQRTDDGSDTPTYEDVDVTIYRLYYTTDSTVNTDSKWILYKDSESDKYANNANIYLVYEDNQVPVTVHFIDTNGNAIKDSDGKDLNKVIDASDYTSEYDLASYAKANAPSGYSFSDSNMNSNNAGTNKIVLGDSNGSVTIGSIKGTYYRYLKYEDNTVKLARGDKNYQNASNPVNIYITFTKNANDSNDPTKVTIHHVDQYGAMLANDTTDGFGFMNGNASNISAFTNRWNGSSANSTSGISYFEQKAVSGIGTYQKAYIGKMNEQSNLGDRGLFYKKDSSTGTWHTGTGDMGTNGSSVTTEIKKDDQPVLYTDIYNVYSGEKGLTIHYVDEDGKVIKDDSGTSIDDNGTFDPNQLSSIDGYTFKEARISSKTGKLFTAIQYKKNDDNSWQSTVKNGDSTVDTDSNPINEIWLVYTKGTESKKLTLHYKYVNKSGTYSDAYYGDNSSNKTDTLNVTSGKENYLVTDPNKNGAYVNTIHEGNVKRPAESGESSPQSVIYMSSHLASEDGPTVTSVEVNADGELIYHTNLSGTAEAETESSNATSWTLSEPLGAQKGRSIVITKDTKGNLKLKDSQNGDMSLNLVNDAKETGNANSRVGEEYKTTYRNDNYTVEYTVTPETYNRTESDGTVTELTRYGVEVTDSYKSESTDIYQIYIDGSSDQDKLWIEDDMKYSGLFRTDVSDTLQSKLSNATNVSYEWHRITIPSTQSVPTEITEEANKNYEIVRRSQSGEHWNIALDADKATWLDIEADEGNDVWKAGTKHAYYVKLTYTPKDSSTPVTIYSTPLTVNYYGQLENGSFETPSKISGAKNYVEPDYDGDYSNEKYKSSGGVWQTTGPGSTRTGASAHGRDYNGKDIEIVNATDHSTLRIGYHWRNGDDSQTSWAADGNQFAELNAENAGALYQDVITHPNENINYWLSHRARGSRESDTKNYYYDTMYVVIMPTKLAMTEGNNNTELKTQTELQNFIRKHGGFDSTVIKGHDDGSSEESKLTYYDEDSGIMIYKVRSDEKDWHNISVVNKYKAKGGLTRFFFCAASTAADQGRGEVYTQYAIDPPTMGNFIDNVGFSQELPPTKGFNLTVTETFSGLTMEQLAGLATNAEDFENKGIKKQTNPLKVTVTNKRKGNSSGANDALNGAILGFTISYDNDNNLVLTPTAEKDGHDLLTSSASVTKPGTSDVHQYSDGRIVITWTFPDQLLSESTGQSTDQTYNYDATDNITKDSQSISTTEVSGFSKTTSQNSVDNNSEGKTATQGSSRGSIGSDISIGSDKSLNIINVYSPSVHISVRKTFTGVTPTTVNEMMNGTEKNQGHSYFITITKGSESKILKVDGGYDSKDNSKDNTVSVSHSTGNDGSTTYVWTITDTDWRDATYSVKENNYTTERNHLANVKVNGSNVNLAGDTDPTVTVESSTEAKMTFDPTATQDNNGVITLTSGSLPDTPMNSRTNLVVGQYTLTTTENEQTITTKKYIVWTSADVGLITRRAIIKQINTIWDETSKSNQATSSNTSFFAGDNAYVVADGRVARMVSHQSASLTGQGSNDKWDKFYAAHMTANSNNTSVDESEIRIDNEYTPKIKIQKQSSETTDVNGESTHARLNGAEFKIYIKDGLFNLGKNYLKSSGNNREWNGNSEEAKIFKTAKDDTKDNLGDGIAYLGTLPADDNTIYYLEESKAPDGYNKIDDIAFKVKSNGTVVLVDENGTITSNKDDVELRFIDPYYTLIINDTPGSALPNTGASGTTAIYLAGALLVSVAIILYKKRREHQTDDR